MTDIIRQQSPSASEDKSKIYDPWETNADLASATLAKELIAKWPKPAIDTRKFTIIHGLLRSLNHSEENRTFLDIKPLIKLMDEVSEKSVNVDGFLIRNIFAYLMHPKYIIQGMPQATTPEEEKPSTLSRLWPGNWGKGKSQEAQKQ